MCLCYEGWLIELRQLEYFLVVARREHFTQAAKELHVAQPSLSRAIGRLEAELGAPLFDRTGRQVRLNAFGQRFLQHVKRACNELEDGKRELQANLDPERGSLGLGFLPTVGLKLLPSLLCSFRESYPLVGFQLVQDSGVELLHQTRAGVIDLCIASLPPERQGLGGVELLRQEIFLAVPPKHQFAGRASLCLSDAADESFISLKPGKS
jgi:LysR family transcriptional activator of glutamate synthase operon